MSQQNISAFFEKLSVDTELQREATSIHDEARRLIAERLSALSRKHDFPFAADDLLASGGAPSAELSDETLSSVNGGTFFEDFARTFSGLNDLFPGVLPKRNRN